MTHANRFSYRLAASLVAVITTGFAALAPVAPASAAPQPVIVDAQVPPDISRDLGDAPDSTNHFGAAMTAYPGVQANYPTVFDPAAGAPPGPAHLDPRPFHLGPLVSREAEADVGPDEDPMNNIMPPANTPNLDYFDDGILPWNLQHCRRAYLPVRIFISQQAAAVFAENDQPGYLNIWLDSNRDGDWADGFNCQDSFGQNHQAVEHVLIDWPVNVAALGPGLHTVQPLSGYIAWPAAMAEATRWVRISLSESPSNKPLVFGGINYGDGRGFPTPFKVGETEDYLKVLGVGGN
jgi:hypothetical protein